MFRGFHSLLIRNLFLFSSIFPRGMPFFCRGNNLCTPPLLHKISLLIYNKSNKTKINIHFHISHNTSFQALLTSPIITADCASHSISFSACWKNEGCGLPTTSALTSEANSRAVTKGPGPSASPSPLL